MHDETERKSECVCMYEHVFCACVYAHPGPRDHCVAMVTSTTRAHEAKATGSQRANQIPDTYHAIFLPFGAFLSLKSGVHFKHLY